MSSTMPVTLTARQQHWCSLCHQPIAPGERYVRWRWFGDCASTIKAHEPCERLRDAAGVCEWDTDVNVIWEILHGMSSEEAEEAIAAAGTLDTTWLQWREEMEA